MPYHILVASLTLMALLSYTCSQSNSDGSVLKTEPSELDWLQVYDMTHVKDWSQSTFKFSVEHL